MSIKKLIIDQCNQFLNEQAKKHALRLMQKDLDEIKVIDIKEKMVEAHECNNEYKVIQQTIETNEQVYEIDLSSDFGEVCVSGNYNVFWDSSNGTDIFVDVPEENPFIAFLEKINYYDYFIDNLWELSECFQGEEIQKRVDSIIEDAKQAYPGLKEIIADDYENVRMVFETDAQIRGMKLSDIEYEVQKYKKRKELV